MTCVKFGNPTPRFEGLIKINPWISNQRPVAVAKGCELQVFNTPCLVKIDYFNKMLGYKKKSEKIR